jgi:hypothetical protein
MMMADDPNLRRPQDSSRINMNQEHEVRWWTKEFGCTREQLQKAVQAVGVSADKVRDYLRRK